MKKKLSNVLAGVSGEYFVSGELSRMGYIASLTLKNTQGIDLLVSNENASNSAGIQVKSSTHSQREWMLNSKAESFIGDHLFYVFVSLKEPGVRPDFFVVPSKVVAEYVQVTHREWLQKPGMGGKKHKDSPIRKFRDLDGEYLEKWNLLKL